MKGTIVVSPVQFHRIHLTHQGICGECLLTASRHHLLQIPSAMLLSLAYGGNMFRSALGPYAAMLNIYMTAAVADTVAVPIWMRCIAAVFTVSGTIVGGARMISVTGDTCSAGTPQLVNLPCLLSLDSSRVVDRASNWTQMAASMMVPSRAGQGSRVMLMAYVFIIDSCLIEWCCCHVWYWLYSQTPDGALGVSWE